MANILLHESNKVVGVANNLNTITVMLLYPIQHIM